MQILRQTSKILKVLSLCPLKVCKIVKVVSRIVEAFNLSNDKSNR